MISRYVYIYIHLYLYIYKHTHSDLCLFQLHSRHISQYSLNKQQLMKQKGFYFLIYTAIYSQFRIIYMLHNNTVHASRSEEFSAFPSFNNKHIIVCIYIYVYIYVYIYTIMFLLYILLYIIYRGRAVA